MTKKEATKHVITFAAIIAALWSLTNSAIIYWSNPEKTDRALIMESPVELIVYPVVTMSILFAVSRWWER